MMFKKFCHTLVYLFLCMRYAEGNSDEIAKLVMDYHEFCPHTDTCNFSVSIRQWETGMMPCCGVCDCENCEKNCCPDAINITVTDEEMEQIKNDEKTCVFAQVRRFDQGKTNGMSFMMLSRCPNGFNDSAIVKKCEREYDEFEFEGNAPNLLYWNPVTSLQTNDTYKNAFCAICHEVDINSLRNWPIALACKTGNRVVPKITHVQHISHVLEKSDGCNIIFNPRPDVQLPQRCESGIDRCNITGKWTHYDKFTEKACMSYKSIYNNTFKNIHCALCNGINGINGTEMCERPVFGSSYSYLAYLDFNDLEKDGPQGGEQCSAGTVFDPYQKRCRSFICPQTWRPKNDWCEPAIPIEQNVGGFTTCFDVAFTVKPSEGVDKPSMSTWMYFAGEFLRVDTFNRLNVLNNEYHNDSIHIELNEFASFLKLNSNISDLLEDMTKSTDPVFHSHISYLGVRVKLRVHYRDSDFESIFASVKNAFINFKSLDHMEVVFQELLKDNFNNGLQNAEQQEYIRNLNASKLIKDKLTVSFNDMKDGSVIVPMEMLKQVDNCSPFINIYPKGDCPLLAIPVGSVRKSRGNANKWLEVEINDFLMHFETWILSFDGRSVYVCWFDYLDNMEEMQGYYGNRKQQETQLENEMWVLTVVCLCVSLISLVITFIVYCLIPSLRSLPGLNNMALVGFLFLSQTLSHINSVTDVTNTHLCSAIGLILHWSLVSGFAWMFVCTFHMLKVFVRIRDKSVSMHKVCKFVKYFIFAETVSTSIVVISIVSSYIHTRSLSYGGKPCYLQGPENILFFVGIPLAVSVVLNITMFCYVVFKVLKMPNMAKSSSTHNRNFIVIFAKLSTLTGISWVFGFLYEFTASQLCAYLFIILNAGQGVFVMLSFVVNERVYTGLRAVCGNSVYTTSSNLKQAHYNTNTHTDSHSHSNTTTHISRQAHSNTTKLTHSKTHANTATHTDCQAHSNTSTHTDCQTHNTTTKQTDAQTHSNTTPHTDSQAHSNINTHSDR